MGFGVASRLVRESYLSARYGTENASSPSFVRAELQRKLYRCSVARLPPLAEARSFALNRLTAGLPFSKTSCTDYMHFGEAKNTPRLG